MRKNIFKKSLYCLLLIVFAISFFAFTGNKNVYAESNADLLNYVSLGDDILYGSGLDGYSIGTYLKNSASDVFYNKLTNEFLNGSTVTAKSVSQCADGLTSADLARDIKLVDLKDTKVLTLSIGMNDIVDLVKENAYSYLTGGCDLAAMLNQAKAEFKDNLTTIINKINGSGVYIKVLCLNYFNPYKNLIDFNHNINVYLSDLEETNIINNSKIREFGNLIDSIINGTNGYNKILKDCIANKERFYLVDINQELSKQSNYSSLIKNTISNVTTITTNSQNVATDFGKCLSPNLSAISHNLIGNKIYNDLKNSFYMVEFDFNSGYYNQKTSFVCLYNKNNAIVNNPVVPEKASHSLENWRLNTENGAVYDFNKKESSNIKLVAKWIKDYFAVTFNGNGGYFNGEVINTVNIKNGASEELKNVEKPYRNTDYEFVTWTKDVNGQEEWNYGVDKVTKEMTLYAKWEKVYFSITYDVDGGSFLSPTTKVYKNTTIPKSEEIPYKFGYLFTGWYSDSELNNPFDFDTKITKDTTLYAGWVEAITVTFSEITSAYNCQVPVGTKIGELEEVNNQFKTLSDIFNRKGLLFYGCYYAEDFINEANPEEVLQNNNILYVKFSELKIKDESALKQSFSPLCKNIEFSVNAKEGQTVKWYVDDIVKKEVVCEEDEVVNFSYRPEKAGETLVYCTINDKEIYKKEIYGIEPKPTVISMNYSLPLELNITIDKVVGKKTYHIHIDESQYFDPSKFIWYSTIDLYSDEFDIVIGTGATLVQTFDSDCKIRAVYVDESFNSEIISNTINISVDKYFDSQIIIAIIITALVGVFVVALCVISLRRYKKYF